MGQKSKHCEIMWLLCSGPHSPTPGVIWALLWRLWGRRGFQAPSGFRQNPVPCGRRKRGSSSLTCGPFISKTTRAHRMLILPGIRLSLHTSRRKICLLLRGSYGLDYAHLNQSGNLPLLKYLNYILYDTKIRNNFICLLVFCLLQPNYFSYIQ